MAVLVFIDGLRASWMMSEQMVLWEHERTADEKTPDLSHLKSWKKQGESMIKVPTSKYLFSSKTFPFCLSLLCLPWPLLCADCIHVEILVCPSLHRPHPGNHHS